jgi:hypothetical protein
MSSSVYVGSPSGTVFVSASTAPFPSSSVSGSFDVNYIINQVNANLSSLLTGPAVVIALAILIGVAVLANALRFEAGKNVKTALLSLCLLLEALLFLIFLPNPVSAFLGFILIHVVVTALFLVYGLMRSKQIYDSMKQAQTIAGNYSTLFWIGSVCLIVGQVLAFVFFLEMISLYHLSWLSQLLMFVGYCCWLHFLNVMRQTAASPRVIRRMFWAAVGVILLAVAFIGASFAFGYAIVNSSGASVSVNGTQVSSEIRYSDVLSSLKAYLVLMSIFFMSIHLCYVTLSGYTIWDICKLTKEQWEKDYDLYHGRANNNKEMYLAQV